MIAGTKHWFPNFVLKLVRSNLPPHQQVLYAPQHFNKFDLKQILTKLYDVKVLDVRTMNLLGRRPKMIQGKKKGGKPAFKKVIVTTDKDFVFPPPPSVKESGAIQIPPQTGKGKNSANHNRKLVLQQAKERGTI